MMGGVSQGKPTPSTNSSKREPYPKWASIPRKEENECTPEATKQDHHNPFSGDSLSPQRKKQQSNVNLHGEF